MPNSSITIIRGNVVLDIPAEQKEYYMNLGYSVIDEKGNVVEAAIPTDLATLQRYYKDSEKKIEAMKAHTEELTARIESLKSEILNLKRELEVASEKVKEAEEPAPTPAPKKRTSKKKAE